MVAQPTPSLFFPAGGADDDDDSENEEQEYEEVAAEVQEEEEEEEEEEESTPLVRRSRLPQKRAEAVAEAGSDQSDEDEDQDEEQHDGDESGWMTPPRSRVGAGKSKRKTTPRMGRIKLRSSTTLEDSPGQATTPGSAATPQATPQSGQVQKGGRVPNLKVKAKRKKRPASEEATDPEDEAGAEAFPDPVEMEGPVSIPVTTSTPEECPEHEARKSRRLDTGKEVLQGPKTSHHHQEPESIDLPEVPSPVVQPTPTDIHRAPQPVAVETVGPVLPRPAYRLPTEGILQSIRFAIEAVKQENQDLFTALSRLSILFKSRSIGRNPEFMENLQKENSDLRIGKIEAERESQALRKKLDE